MLLNMLQHLLFNLFCISKFKLSFQQSWQEQIQQRENKHGFPQAILPISMLL